MLVWPQAENGSKNVFKKGERHVKLIQWCSKEEEKNSREGQQMSGKHLLSGSAAELQSRLCII